jgi:hypothetical protein
MYKKSERHSYSSVMGKLRETDYANDLDTGLVIILKWILIVMGLCRLDSSGSKRNHCSGPVTTEIFVWFTLPTGRFLAPEKLSAC